MTRAVLPNGGDDAVGCAARRSNRMSLSASLDAVGLQHDNGQSRRAREMLGLPQAQRVCFVMVDGLGWLNLSARFGHAPTLRSWQAQDPLSTVVPSTTAAAITSIGTAQNPGSTAMLSYELCSPVTEQPFSLITWKNSGIDPHEWQSVPTIFERLGEDASSCVLIHQADFVDSGLTRCALRGVRSIAAETLSDRVEAAGKALRNGKRAVYLYWGELDHRGHNKGWNSEEWIGALEDFDAGMRRLTRVVPRDTLIVLTADHGMIDVSERIDVSQISGLLDGITVVSGEERALHLYCDRPDEIAARWENELGDRSWIFTKDEARTMELFGDMSDFSLSVCGDVLVFQKHTVSLVDARGRDPLRPFMVGVHGSLTEQEMLVPLLVEVV